MIIAELEQHTAEWHEMRCGRVTASRVADVIAQRKKGDGELQCRIDYRAELVCERITGSPYPHVVTTEMKWGTEQEPFARAAYECAFNCSVEQVGFSVHDSIPNFGASPDGLVGESGLVEFKCPTTATHLRWIFEGIVPEEHQAQMLAEMACTETARIWCDFVSFDPRVSEQYQLFVRRFFWDEKRITDMEFKVNEFLDQVEKEVEALRQCKPLERGE